MKERDGPKILTLQVSGETRARLEQIMKVTGVSNLKTACEVLVRAYSQTYCKNYLQTFATDPTEWSREEEENPAPPVSMESEVGPAPMGYAELIQFDLD